MGENYNIREQSKPMHPAPSIVQTSLSRALWKCLQFKKIASGQRQIGMDSNKDNGITRP